MNNAKKSYVLKWVLLIAIFILTITFIAINRFSFSSDGIELFINNWKAFFRFNSNSLIYVNYNLWHLSFKLLIQTIHIVFLSSLIGFLIALITSYLSNFYTTNFWISTVIKTVIGLIKALPISVFLFYFQKNYSPIVALMLCLIWFSWLWNNKYLVGYFKDLDYSIYFDYLKTKPNKLIAFYKTLYFQLKAKWIGLLLYSFDSNIRWTTLLSSVGFIGIGSLISDAFNNDISQIAIPITVLACFLLTLEIALVLINKYVINKKQKPLVNKVYLYKKVLIKNLISWVVIALLIISLIVGLGLIDWTNTLETNSNYFANLIKFDFAIFNNIDLKNNLVNELLLLITNSFVVVVISYLIALFLAFFSIKAFYKKTSYLILILISLIRAFPVVGLFYMFDPLFSSNNTLVFVLCISLMCSFYKQLYVHLNEIKTEYINDLKLQQNSKLKIYKDFLLLNIKKQNLSLILFMYEQTYRDLVDYGLIGFGIVGIVLDELIKKNLINQFGAVLLVVYICLITINSISSLFSLIYENKSIINIPINKLKHFWSRSKAYSYHLFASKNRYGKNKTSKTS